MHKTNAWLLLNLGLVILICFVFSITVFTYSVNGTADFGDEPKNINSLVQVTFH